MISYIKQYWFKMGILIVLAFSAYYYFIIFLATQQQENLLNQQTSNIQKDIELQDKCSQEAKSFFDYFVTDPQSKQTAEFSNHFNIKLNKCFVLIKTYNQTNFGGIFSAGTNKDMYDAVERKVYASYSWMSKQNMKYWEVPPLSCDIYQDGNISNHQICKSEGEFDNFVSSYMNN